MITVDTGITAVEAVDFAKSKNVDVIVTDHHLQKETLPDTPYIVNPNQDADSSGYTYLCGVGVAFYLALATRKILQDDKFFGRKNLPYPDMKQWLDLFTLGTVSPGGTRRCTSWISGR